jgi:hypothetical protein
MPFGLELVGSGEGFEPLTFGLNTPSAFVHSNAWQTA